MSSWIQWNTECVVFNCNWKNSPLQLTYNIKQLYCKVIVSLHIYVKVAQMWPPTQSTDYSLNNSPGYTIEGTNVYNFNSITYV